MSEINEILAEARRLAGKSENSADLSNALFDPLDGLIAKRFADPADRMRFARARPMESSTRLWRRRCSRRAWPPVRTDEERLIRPHFMPFPAPRGLADRTSRAALTADSLGQFQGEEMGRRGAFRGMVSGPKKG